MTTQGATAQGAGAAAQAAPFGDPARADAAHRALRSDSSIQFDFPWFMSDKPVVPDWLKSLLDAVRWIGDGWTVITWLTIGIAVVAFAWALHRSLRAWLLNRRGQDDALAHKPGWSPEAATARALLDEADGLAASGAYDRAVRLLLHRSVEDIERWRGDPLRPSLTSRDIARIDALPDAARAVFGRIVADVERSLFAGHPLGEADWTRARADYAGFALRQ